jgi:predicted HAD superfamily Cof-like phosphohydrolase
MYKKDSINQIVEVIINNQKVKDKKLKIKRKKLKHILEDAAMGGYFVKSDSYITQLEEFHRVFGHLIGVEPIVPDTKLANLRLGLIQEELNELKQAIEDNNKTEILDALCDLQYVLTGAIVSMGYQNIFSMAFDEVHISNMSKTCSNEQEAIESIEIYKNEGIDVFYRKVDDIYVLYRKSDNKILKNRKGFLKPNLNQFIKI